MAVTLQELDLIMAEQVLGYHIKKDKRGQQWVDSKNRRITGTGAWYPHLSEEQALPILNRLAEMGHAPSLLCDDNGHWALASDGTHIVPNDDRPAETLITHWVSRDAWYDTIAEAICWGARRILNL